MPFRHSHVLATALVAFAFIVVGCSHEAPTVPQEPSAGLPVAQQLSGKSIATAGVGLAAQPAFFSIDIPVTNSSEILEATFYFAGRARNSGAGDPTIIINGFEHTAQLLNALDLQQSGRWAFFYKLDALGLVEPGLNTFTVEGFVPAGIDERASGIGLAVIYSDAASPCDEILVIEPSEFLFWGNAAFPQGEVRAFTFDAAAQEREGALVLFVGDTTEERPDRIWWHADSGVVPADLIDGPYNTFENQLTANVGPQYDVFRADNLVIPSGADYFAYQLQSPRPGDGDSMLHAFAAFCVSRPVQSEPGDGCFRTIGFWKHQFNVALGHQQGHQHISNEVLESLLAVVAGVTAVGYDAGDGVISFEEAHAYLDLSGQQSKCARARQQYLALLLNYAWNHGDDSLEVDTDYDGDTDMTLGEAVEAIESMILGASDPNSSQCETAKDMADSINNMGGCEE